MGFKYEKIDGNSVVVTGINDNSKSDIIIPSEIEGRKVVRIGDNAFDGCNSLTSVNIPDSVTEIGDEAFYACYDLTSVTIPDSVTKIGDYAFNGCRSLTSITIPDSVTKIGDYAFGFCSDLTSVTIPDRVTKIGVGAFYNCTNLTSVTIPDRVTFIGERAFAYCTNLISRKSNYKAFALRDDELWCRDYKFEENEWSNEVENIELCKRGYHFCTNLFEIFNYYAGMLDKNIAFNYYAGMLDKDIAIYECEIGDKVIESETSKCVTNKIKPIRRLSRQEIIDILNGKEG